MFRWSLSGETGAGEGRFDASYKHHPVTESSYINSLANSPYRSTVKTLPATLPEPWTVVRGPRSKHQGPWSTDLEPRIVGLGSRFKPRVPKASPLTRSRSESRKTRLYDRGARNVVLGPRTGVTGVVWEIWIELGRGAGCGFGALAARTHKIFEIQSHQSWSK